MSKNETDFTKDSKFHCAITSKPFCTAVLFIDIELSLDLLILNSILTNPLA